MPLLHIDPLYSLSGLFVGFLVGLTGVGGGSLMTPILVLLFNVHPATAVGTDLLYAALTKATGTFVHGLKGTVEWRITGRLAAGSVPAAAITLWFLHAHGMHSQETSRMIQFVLGAALLLTSLSLLFRPQLAAFAARRTRALPPSPTRTLAATVLTGAVLGVLVSLTSVGAGAIGVTVLLLLYPTLSTTRIVGSDIAHAVPLTLVAGVGHWMLGSVDWSILVSLLIGSVPGIVVGSHLSARAPEGLLRRILATMLVAVGAKLVLS